MNIINNPVIFYSASALILVFSILAIKFRNIFYSLLSAIVVFFMAGIIFYILGSEYNAVIQIAIYGIAVPIVLGLAVMFTNTKKDENSKTKSLGKKYLIFLVSGIFILAITYLAMISFAVNPSSIVFSEPIKNSSIQVLNSFGYALFVKYVWAFELISVILTIIVVGLAFLGEKEEECTK